MSESPSTNDSKSRVFRARALQSYLKRTDRSVLPKLVSPRTFTIAWVLFAILIAAGATAWFTSVPVYANGTVVVVKRDGFSRDADKAASMVLLMPPETLANLKSGQEVLLWRHANASLHSLIVAVEPATLSPQSAQERFSLSAGAASQIKGPVAVAFVSWRTLGADPSPLSYIGSFYDASVQVGSRPVISLLPVLGKFFRPRSSKVTL